VEHPLGCHQARLPDRVIFEKLVEVLVFGYAYWQIADGSRTANFGESNLRGFNMTRREVLFGTVVVLLASSPVDHPRSMPARVNLNTG
jgi:hypothetical protein